MRLRAQRELELEKEEVKFILDQDRLFAENEEKKRKLAFEKAQQYAKF